MTCDTHGNTIECVGNELCPLSVASESGVHLSSEGLVAGLTGPGGIHHHVHAGLPDHCGAELGGDGLLKHREHPGVHVDDLGVAAPDPALAHVALAAGHEARHLQSRVGGAHFCHHLFETVELGSLGINVVLVDLG